MSPTQAPTKKRQADPEPEIDPMAEYNEVTEEELMADVPEGTYEELTDDQITYVASRVVLSKAIANGAPAKVLKALRENNKECRVALELAGEPIPKRDETSETVVLAKAKVKPTTPHEKKDKSKDCLCGCGGRTKGGTFIPGHDAKLKGFLIRVEAGKADVNDLPQSTQDRLATCSCCGYPIMEHESGMGPICRAGNCHCKEIAAQKLATAAKKAQKSEVKKDAESAATAASTAVKQDADKKKKKK